MSTKAKHMHGAYADTDSLAGLVFSLSGKFSESHAALTSYIKRNAGDVRPSVSKAVTHLLSTVDDFAAHTAKVQRALTLGIPVVTERWVRESIESNETLPLRPEFVLHPGNQLLARPEQEALDTNSSSAKDSTEVTGEKETVESMEPVTFTHETTQLVAPRPGLLGVGIDEGGTPSALLTAAKDASLPTDLPVVGDLPAPKPLASDELIATMDKTTPTSGDKRTLNDIERETQDADEPAHKRRKTEDAEITESAPPDVQGPLERAPPEADTAVLPPSQSLSIPAPPPARQTTPSGAETGGPSAMQVTQRAYHLKVLQRREYSASTVHEITGLLEKQLLEGINVHNGFGSVREVVERGDGVDAGAILLENLRDYAHQDYYTLITYALRGNEFGSVHRNDEIVSCGLMRHGKLNAVRKEDEELMDRIMHVHQPLIPISESH